ncbi:MAG: cbb3-type cytochrome c oxidase subunit 3 [Burkholderiales bacterium]
MDITMTEIRSWMTVVQFVVFAGIVWWAYGSTRKGRFEEAARLVLDDDDAPAARPNGAARGR